MKQEFHQQSEGFSAPILILALLVVILVGIVSYVVSRHKYLTSNNSPTPRPAVLTISRSNPLHQPEVSFFTASITDSKIRDAIFSDVKQLSSLQQGTVSCPNDDGVSYKLYFVTQKLTVTASTTGCQVVKLSNSSVAYKASSTFWKDINRATGSPIDPYSHIQYY